jgi:hypothetical protein
MRRKSTLLTVALVLIAGGGCGTSEAERVQGVFKERLVASAENDHERVCALMTPEYRRERYSAVQQTSLGDCLVEERRRATPATPRQQRSVEEVQIANVEIEGDTATAYVRLRGCTLGYTGTTFRRVANGEWRYDGSLPSNGREPRCLK